jgi:hypothetical protein
MLSSEPSSLKVFIRFLPQFPAPIIDIFGNAINDYVKIG